MDEYMENLINSKNFEMYKNLDKATLKIILMYLKFNLIEMYSQTETEIAYEITAVGTYTFTVTVTDEQGNFTPREFTFEVTNEASDPTLTRQIIGTVLIVISVLVLAGVIIYFVVSKVKLDKELKK